MGVPRVPIFVSSSSVNVKNNVFKDGSAEILVRG